MGNSSDHKSEKHICIGLLAHVDAGKTTLAEAMLYQTGQLRRLGRVDHRDAFLDTYELERARGITIFSKQAQLVLDEKEVTLLDTPGHVDFSAEMERTLQVLDYAVLVISGADGVQAHVETLWRLLKRYQVPVFLFINKMDQEGSDRARLLTELRQRLDERCVDFADELSQATFQEELAMCDDGLLEAYLEGTPVTEADVRRLIASRLVFPCYFGSALKLQGVDRLLEGMSRYTVCPAYPASFGARIYKISRDSQGTRLTHMKITGGSLRVKELLTSGESMGATEGAAGETYWAEKVDQIRVYSGAGFQAVEEAPAGSICAVAGLSRTQSGRGLGHESAVVLPVLEPVLTYRIDLPEGCDVHGMLRKLKQLEEEEPQLHIVWKEGLGEIHAQVMGDVQIEVLKSLIAERFGIEAAFGAGHIVYKETIAEAVEGIGHFEPLRHYAEVHLLLEPGEPGSGLQLDTACSEDVLDKNWQRLILTHLEEQSHPGVLTGSEITDLRITVIGGRAHKKHTEGGDFRQATYRAVRQGLRKAKSVLLEPVYDFRLELPPEALGRAMTDLQRMNGSFGTPETVNGRSVLTGSVPAASLGDYGRQVAGYTGGRGQLSCTFRGYEPCHNVEEVVAALAYDPEADVDHPCGSVFCAHGAGFVVPWDQVDAYAHVDCGLHLEEAGGRAGEAQRDWGRERGAEAVRKGAATGGAAVMGEAAAGVASALAGGSRADITREEEKELELIFERTYGPVKRRGGMFEKGSRREAGGDAWKEEKGNRRNRADSRSSQLAGKNGTDTSIGKAAGCLPAGTAKSQPEQEEYLLVDGYNIIFAWEELKELAGANLEAARGRLMDILSNYQGYRRMTLILVFDAYRVEGGVGEVFRYHNIHVVYTKEAETADQYIEKTVHRIGRHHAVTVATSDALEQVIILGQGARRISAREFREEVRLTEQEIRREHLHQKTGERTYLFDQVDEELAEKVERMRLGKAEEIL